MFSMIVAVDENNAIGYNGDMLYRIPNDLKRFKDITTGHTVVMGRKTYESIGHALPNRTNIILTRDKNYKVDDESVIIMNNHFDIIEKYEDSIDEVFIIGGAELYKLFLPICKKIYLTKILSFKIADTYFPKIQKDKWTSTDLTPIPLEYNRIYYKYINYERIEINE